MPNWKKIIVSGSDASLSSAYIEGNLTASAAYLTSASIGHLETIYETASVIYSSGSTKFGDTSDDTHERTGSVDISGSLIVDGDTSLSNLAVTNTSADDSILLLTTTEDSNNAGPVITLKRNSSTPADSDYLGQLKFKGENDADQEVVYAKITAKIKDASDGSEDGNIEFANRRGGLNVITARLSSDKLQLLNGTDLDVDGDVTADNFTGTASIADFATTASHALNVPDTASHALTAITSSHTIGTASLANTATTSSYTLTGDGVFSGSFSGSFAGDASQLNVNPFPFTGSGEMQGKLTIESFNDYVDDYAEGYYAGTAIASSGDIALTGSIFSPYINANSFTGSLSGSATSASLAETSSLAVTASHAITASYAENAGGGGGFPFSGSALITGSLIVSASTTSDVIDFTNSTGVSGSFSGSFQGDGSNLTGISIISSTITSTPFSSVTSVTASHNFGSENVVVQVYDGSNNLIVPSNIRVLDSNEVGVDFASTRSGRVTVSKGGHLVSGSIENAQTASYGNSFTASNLYVEGTASITYLESVYETSSVIYSSGSTKFGDDTSDTHEITGSLEVSGSANLVASQSVNNNTLSGSLSFWNGSQTEYDALGSYDNNTIYFVVA